VWQVEGLSRYLIGPDNQEEAKWEPSTSTSSSASTG
jgi:hypothetical protein